MAGRHPGVLSEQVDDWPAWLHGEEQDEAVAALRRYTSTGRPLGSATFLNLLESMLGRTVRPRKAGRPKKTEKEPEIWVASPVSGISSLKDW